MPIHLAIAVAATCLLTGCTWQERPRPNRDRVEMFLDSGSLRVGNFDVEPDDLPALAGEIGERTVIITAVNNPELNIALEARKKLLAAGFKKVLIRGVTD